MAAVPTVLLRTSQGLHGEQLTDHLGMLLAGGTEESSCGWSSLPGQHVSLALGWRLQRRCRNSLVKDGQFIPRRGIRDLRGHMEHHGSPQESCWTATHLNSQELAVSLWEIPVPEQAMMPNRSVVVVTVLPDEGPRE